MSKFMIAIFVIAFAGMVFARPRAFPNDDGSQVDVVNGGGEVHIVDGSEGVHVVDNNSDVHIVDGLDQAVRRIG